MRRIAAITIGLATAGSILAARVPAEAATTAPYIRPVVGPIVRHFERPPTPYAAGHRGIDLAVPFGTIVLAANNGTVAFAGQVGGLLFVSIDHADGLRTTYSYLSAVLVKKGQIVARGQAVARSGAGDPGGKQPVLHFGVKRGEEYLDPEPMLLDGLRREPWRAIRLAPDDE